MPESPDWRELCAAAAVEQDSTRLASLVNRIIEAFDRQSCAPPMQSETPRLDGRDAERNSD